MAPHIGRETLRRAISTAAAAAALTLAAGGCASTAGSAPEQHFFVVRHLQKAGGDDPGLTTEGQECARRLAALLGRQGISAVYASTTRRARETAAPLAAARNLAVQDYPPTDLAGVAARAQAEQGSVLVVGHSNTVPELVERLGGTRPGPIDEANYGEVWRIARHGARNGGATLSFALPGCGASAF